MLAALARPLGVGLQVPKTIFEPTVEHLLEGPAEQTSHDPVI
jgi:hypothetical protein